MPTKMDFTVKFTAARPPRTDENVFVCTVQSFGDEEGLDERNWAEESGVALAMNRLVLPLPPSKNKSHRNISIHRRVRTHETMQYFSEAGWTARVWMQKNGWKTPTKGIKVVMRYWVYWPDLRIRDPGNVIEALSDSLKGILFVDDQYVLPQAMDYGVDKLNPRIEVEVEVMA